MTVVPHASGLTYSHCWSLTRLLHSAARLLGTVESASVRRLFSAAAEAGLADGRSGPDRILKFGVVGSGPAGFYIVSQLLKTFGGQAEVSLLERLPTPFGLVRSGVAPDHPETKNVEHQFSELGRDSRVHFFGNVTAGTDISLSTLRTLYDAVILAYGAESSQVLNIPGRHFESIFSARAFVWWYNGHPEYQTLPISLGNVRRVAILGLGNVALDCARILLQPPERLAGTDISSHALAQLCNSQVERVDLIGRRGIAQAAFTAKELREVVRMDEIGIVMPEPSCLELTSADRAAIKASRARRRVVELLQSAATNTEQARVGRKQLGMHFLRSPVEAIADDLGRVAGLRLEKMSLQEVDGRQTAVPTGSFETLRTDLVLESIGYRSLPLQGAPFDAQTGTIPNREGRVTSSRSPDAEHLEGLYACGWVKRGPSGIIGTNLVDASETVHSIAEDVQRGILGSGNAPAGATGLTQELEAAGRQVVTFKDWQRIDDAEVAAGKASGKTREKFTDVQQMLAACSNC